MKMRSHDIHANWPKFLQVSALTTTRKLGVSTGVYAAANLALHVDDDPIKVQQNRKDLKERLELPSEPIWLDQIHSTRVIDADYETNRKADAAFSRNRSSVLAIMTADCLPILCTDKSGSVIAAIHAGWRGLADGIIENTLSKLNTNLGELFVWLGPAICQTCFEVGEEVKASFLKNYPFTNNCFLAKSEKWLADLPKLAREILLHLGVSAIFSSNLCTFERNSEFYSYRRDKQTGRMVSLIWFNNNQG